MHDRRCVCKVTPYNGGSRRSIPPPPDSPVDRHRILKGSAPLATGAIHGSVEIVLLKTNARTMGRERGEI